MQYLFNVCVRHLTALLAFLLFFLSASAVFSDPVEPSRQPLNFGVFSFLGKEETEAKYAPLIAYLNSELVNEEVFLHVLPQEELNRRIRDREVDIVATNPTHFLLARANYPLTGVIATLVASHNGQPAYQLGGAIITTPEHSDINSLQDIKGKIVAIPSRQNMGGYRAQAYELFKVGIRLPDDVRQLLEVGTHYQAVLAVMEGHADVAFVRDGIIEQMQQDGQIQPQDVKFINPQQTPDFAHQVSTRLYPEWPVFALPHVEDRAVRHVAAALFSLEPQHPAALQAGIYGFTVPADYLAVEALARALRLPPYEHSPEFTYRDAWERWHILISVSFVSAMVILILSLALVWHWSKAFKARMRFETLLQGLGEGVYGTDNHGQCTFINEAAMKMLRVSKSKVLGKNQHLLFHHHYQDGRVYPPDECPIEKTLMDGRQRRTQEWFFRQDGSGFPVDMTVTPLFAKHQISGTVVAFSDITYRVKAENENKRLAQYNRMLLESAGHGIYGCDMKGLCTFINPAALRMLGLTHEDVIGRNQHHVFHYNYPDGSEYPYDRCPVYLTLTQGVGRECEDHFFNSDGSCFPVHMKISPVHEESQQVGVVVVFQDITQQKALEQRLVTLTTTDDLTGLYNRRYFQKQLKKEFARYNRTHADVSVLMMDLDHFKMINDTYGHAAGDKVLQNFSELLTQGQRASDLSARVGGEEFALLLPNTAIRDAMVFANRFRKKIATTEFSFEGHTIPLTISIGCTMMKPEDKQPDMVLARADRALYEAKNTGRNRVVAIS